MVILLLAFLIGVVAGLRSLIAPAAISCAARTGVFSLGDGWIAFLGYAWTPWSLSVGALGELISDKLPNTPSRTIAPQFIFRIITGSISGMALGVSGGVVVGGLVAGALGAVAGTLGGAWLRRRLVVAIGGKDLPIALLEDVVAIGGAVLVVSQVH